MERVEGAERVVDRSGQRSPTLSRKLDQYEHVAHPPALSVFGGSVSTFTLKPSHDPQHAREVEFDVKTVGQPTAKKTGIFE